MYLETKLVRQFGFWGFAIITDRGFTNLQALGIFYIVSYLNVAF